MREPRVGDLWGSYHSVVFVVKATKTIAFDGRPREFHLTLVSTSSTRCKIIYFNDPPDYWHVHYYLIENNCNLA